MVLYLSLNLYLHLNLLPILDLNLSLSSNLSLSFQLLTNERILGVDVPDGNSMLRLERPAGRSARPPLDLKCAQTLSGLHNQVYLGLRPRAPEEQLTGGAPQQIVLGRLGNHPVLPQRADVGTELLGRERIQQRVADARVPEENFLAPGNLLTGICAE